MPKFIEKSECDLSQCFGQSETLEGKKLDINEIIPEEIALNIFSHLNCFELARCQRVCKKWKLIAEDKTLWNALLEIEVIEKQWKALFGTIGEAPLLPKIIYKIWNSPCPFWPEKKIKDTHMLLLIPETIDGKPFTLELMGELIKKPKHGHSALFHEDSNDFIKKHKKQAKSHWVLMTKEILEESRNASYADNEEYISRLSKQRSIDYSFPDPIDIITCIFFKYVTSGIYLFGKDPDWTYSQTTEKSIIVGGFTKLGLRAFAYTDRYTTTKSIGMAAQRIL